MSRETAIYFLREAIREAKGFHNPEPAKNKQERQRRSAQSAFVVNNAERLYGNLEYAERHAMRRNATIEKARAIVDQEDWRQTC